MNKVAENIKQRLSMREPLCDALDVVAKITDKLSLGKPPVVDENVSLNEFLNRETLAIKEICPDFKSFDRDFPSLAFSIATGIGKTRLMGACIAYLYIKKGIRNFFILAPNLTIYDKLIRDFGDISYSKYVFRGITEFVHNSPVILTGDNYNKAGRMFSGSEIHINVFNIAKFNTDSKEGKRGAPRMKRLSEYLGQSYFDYLAGLNDLVVLMDEAHRYHADSSKKAVNELRPVLGLELTATPFDEKGKAFKNIVFEYNLAQALADGKYVKNPKIAQRSNVEKGNYIDAELDRLKIEDAISLHELAKFNLELYAKNNDVEVVKPFILVVCRDTTHARETVSLIENDMFDGRYRGKVIQMDSTTKKEMSDEEIRQFAEIERADNPIEIVVHVNMLKEGWDVTNLYTIVPLRAANAITLIEQTIGRGLRLPYGGKRTGNKEVDALTVIVHENFQRVLEQAKDPDSLLTKISYVELDDIVLNEKAVVVTAKSVVEAKFEQTQQHIDTIVPEPQRKEEQATLNAQKAVFNILPTLGADLRNKAQLSTPAIIEIIKKKAAVAITESLKGTLFAEEETATQIALIETVVESVVHDFQNNIIEIPRMVIDQIYTEANFQWFDLDITSGFSLLALKQEIIRLSLEDGQVETILAQSSSGHKDPISMIVMQLMDIDEIDYDKNSELLYHLAAEAVAAIKSNLEAEHDVSQVVNEFKKNIADRIFEQMKRYFTVTSSGFNKPIIYAFEKIYDHNLSQIVSFGCKDYKEIVAKSDVSKTVFTGFKKAYHSQYKFDSSTELDLAFVLENTSPEVLRWLRPASKQFRIYWDSSKRYEPDFIVETTHAIYMLETKARKDVNDIEVQSKCKAAQEYCRNASEYTVANNGKPWKYVIIAHDNVHRTHSLEYILCKSDM